MSRSLTPLSAKRFASIGQAAAFAGPRLPYQPPSIADLIRGIESAIAVRG